MALLSGIEPEGPPQSLLARTIEIPGYLARKRKYVVSFVMVVLVYMLLFGGGTIDDATDALVESARGRLGVVHPVEQLHVRAKAQFEALLERQSKTPPQAEEEYRRRYGRPPPPGFRQWVQFAIAARSPIIDDYDIIDEALASYYKMKPQHFLDLMDRAVNHPQHGKEVALCQFEDGKFKRSEHCQNEGWFNDMEKTLGSGIAANIPNMKFFISYLAEPSVLATQSDNHNLTWTDKQGKSIAKDVHAACALQATKPPSDVKKVEDFGIPFIQDIDDYKNVCNNLDLLHQHGMYVAPGSANFIDAKVPIMSMGKPYPFSDVVIPSPQYQLEKNLHHPGDDMGWEEKRRAVFWTGSTTGSYATAARDESWRNSHRQRLAMRFHEPRNENLSFGTTTYLKQAPYLKTYEPYESDEVDRDLYHIRLTALVQCEKEACAKEADLFKVGGFEPAETAYEYRFNLDIDGNAYTNRFYRLLASHSVPIKVTIFREWHEERLIPWLHYIPASLSFEEMPELVRFLATTDQGDKIAEKIAKAGAEWHDRALTGLHQGIYLYRLMLELAWLQDPARIPVATEDIEGRTLQKSNSWLGRLGAKLGYA
jgi:hypothetical protein